MTLAGMRAAAVPDKQERCLYMAIFQAGRLTEHFIILKKLKVGNDIIVTRGDSRAYTYQVVGFKVYPYDAVDMNAVL